MQAALAETLDREPNSFLIGQDIGEKGGNYGCTDGLRKLFGRLRVRDSLLDETSILGVALGAALNGFLPIVEICYLAYIHNAIDQIRGEASTMSFFSNGQYSNGLIVRVSGGGLTEFGGHFHNENSLSSLLDIPGLLVVYPSNGRDFTLLFRTCVTAAKQGRVVILIEPIKGYTLRSYGPDNQNWMFPYPPDQEAMRLGQLLRHGADSDRDLAVVTYGNGVVLSLEARALLARRGVHVTVFDRPTLAGVNDEEEMATVLQGFPAVLFADESRQQGCISEALLSRTYQRNTQQKFGLVAAGNSFIPLGAAAKVPGLYLSAQCIADAAASLLGRFITYFLLFDFGSYASQLCQVACLFFPLESVW
eukprot:g2014.t1